MSLWKRYMGGIKGRWLFRRERLWHQNGLSVAAGVERDQWQREIFSVFDDSDVRVGYIETPRGFGKTTICAAESLGRLVTLPSHDIFVLACDKDQAKILMNEAIGFVRRDRALMNICRIFRDKIENSVSGSVMQVLASDATSNFGFGVRPYTCVFDEFWGQPNRDVYDAFASALPKSPGSQILILTNSGPDRSGIAWEVREQCRALGDPGLRYWSANPDVLPSWIDASEVERQRRMLPQSVFDRLWRNVWGLGGGSFLIREQVETCIDERLDSRTLRFAKNRRYYLGIDLGLKHDRSVICVMHKEREVSVVDHIQTWFGTPEFPVVLEDVLAHLLRLKKCIPRIKRVYIDPWQGAMMMERAKRAGLWMIEEFVFSSSNLQALSQNLWNAFRSRTIRIPAYELLVDELVTLKIIERSRTWRIDHESGGFSDHATALGLALTAAVTESGELAADDRRHRYFYSEFAPRVNAKMFGLRGRSGLMLVDPPHKQRQGMDIYASIRFLQTLQKMDRISPQEAGVIETQIRNAIWRNRDATRALRCISDGFDAELGSLEAFLQSPSKAPQTTQKGVST